MFRYEILIEKKMYMKIFKNHLRPALNGCHSIVTLCASNIDVMTMYHVRMLV